MSGIARWTFLALLLNLCLNCGAGSMTTPSASRFSAVVFSDLHFDPFYDPTLCPQLVLADIRDWPAIFKTSDITLPSTWGNDTNYPLLVLALSSIKRNSSGTPLVIYTGDLIGHRFSTLFYQYCRSTSVADMQAFTDKTVAFVAAQVRASVGKIPVLFAVGDIDSYSTAGIGPDSLFLTDTAETFYTQFLNGIVDRQEFFNTFTLGGYYSAQPVGTRMMVIALNTVPFSPLVPGDNNAAVAMELAWLDSRLASAKASGQKVWLLMHVPPGADTQTSARNYSANGNLTVATATMLWNQQYQASFLQVLSNYPGIVTLTLGAHTHMDEYRILSPNAVLEEVPAISPSFGADPALKVFTFTSNSFTPIDYTSLTYDLATVPEQFTSFYTFSEAYSVQGSLNASLARLYPQIAQNSGKQVYQGLYASGNDAASPITRKNWPVFACAIGKVAQPDFVACVNSY